MCGGIDDGYSDGVKPPTPWDTMNMETGEVINQNGEVVFIGGTSVGSYELQKSLIAAEFMTIAAGMAASIGYSPFPYALRKPNKKSKPCLLPGCTNTTTHNGGYCCAEHCREHRAKIKNRV